MLPNLILLFQAANALTPLGICGLLIVVIILMTHEKGPIKQLTNNHLEHVQMSLDQIVENGKEHNSKLDDIRADISFVKGKLD